MLIQTVLPEEPQIPILKEVEVRVELQVRLRHQEVQEHHMVLRGEVVVVWHPEVMVWEQMVGMVMLQLPVEVVERET
jgi:hypothetical protein